MRFGPLSFSFSHTMFNERKDHDGEDISEMLLAARESLEHTVEPMLPASSEPDPPQLQNYRKGTYWKLIRRIGLLSLYMTTIILALNGLYHFLSPFTLRMRQVFHPRMPAENLSSCSCGDSLAEAMALSCRYDTIAAAWLPPHCRDAELMAQFDTSGPGVDGAWTYYAD